MNAGVVYLIPSVLDEKATASIPPLVVESIRDCQVFFAENERTARRFFKSIWKEMVIDDYQWYTIHKAEELVQTQFLQCLREGKNVGIVSEAGCPGIADPGQQLVQRAHEAGFLVKPLVGPSSILLALMASGMNGQQFHFHGYLPVDSQERTRRIRELESDSRRHDCTQIFIETPYRNNPLLDALLKTCQPATRLCVAVDLTGEKEWIRSNRVSEWKKMSVDLHKRPAIFLLYHG